MTAVRPIFIFAAICALWWSAGVAAALSQAQTGSTIDNPLALHSLEKMSATRDRPVFFPSRRPPLPPPQPVAAPPIPAAPPSVTLFGIILDANNANAVVSVAPRNDIVRLHVGDEIAGWKVTSIEERRLVLSSIDGRSATFNMFAAHGPAGPRGSAPSPAPPRQAPLRPQTPASASQPQ